MIFWRFRGFPKILTRFLWFYKISIRFRKDLEKITTRFRQDSNDILKILIWFWRFWWESKNSDEITKILMRLQRFWSDSENYYEILTIPWDSEDSGKILMILTRFRWDFDKISRIPTRFQQVFNEILKIPMRFWEF